MNINFLQFFQDSSGEYSSSRGILIVWVIGVLVVWMTNSLTEKALQPIPETVLILIGILITGKAVQKKMEVTQDVDSQLVQKESKTTTESKTSGPKNE